MKTHLIVIAILAAFVFFLQGCSLYVLTQEDQPTPQEPVVHPLSAQQQQILHPPPTKTNITNITASTEEGIFPGEKAPDFVFQLTSGEVIIKNRVLKEKPLVLYFFTTYCLDCLEELDELREIYPAYKSRIRFIAMTTDSTEDDDVLYQFRKMHPSSVNIIELASQKQEILVTFKVTSPGIKIGINKEGIITVRESAELDANEWRDLFTSLV